jgi:hypothetical protein
MASPMELVPVDRRSAVASSCATLPAKGFETMLVGGMGLAMEKVEPPAVGAGTAGTAMGLGWAIFVLCLTLAVRRGMASVSGAM